MDFDSVESRIVASLLAAFVTLMGVAAYRLWLHPLARFPGPSLWAVSRLPWIYHMSNGSMWYRLQLLHQQYGPIVRIAPGELSFSSVAAWPDIYTSRPQMPKEPNSQTPPLNGAHSLFTANGEDHRRLRSVLAAGFSDKALRDQEPGMEYHAVEFIARLRREIAQGGLGSVVDLHKLFGYAALDTITDLSYSGPMHALEERNEHDWIGRFFLHAHFSTVRQCLCWFWPLHRVMDFLVLSLARRQRAKNWAAFGGKIQDRIDQGEDRPGQRTDLITPVMSKVIDETAQHEKGSRGISKKELFCHTLASVVANSQITTVTLTTCTYLLLRHKDVLDQLVDEIRQAFTSDDQITVQSTQDLAYLEAVFNEAMRLHHPTPALLPRVVPAEGRQIDGQFIPGKTIVAVNTHVMHTSPTHWTEPFAFRPARFLPHDDPRYDHRFDKDVKAAYMPFSTGPRKCVGGK